MALYGTKRKSYQALQEIKLISLNLLSLLSYVLVTLPFQYMFTSVCFIRLSMNVCLCV